MTLNADDERRREDSGDLLAALSRIVDGNPDGCGCEHDDELCCANQPDVCCAFCIAAAAIAKAEGR